MISLRGFLEHSVRIWSLAFTASECLMRYNLMARVKPSSFRARYALGIGGVYCKAGDGSKQ